MQTMITRHQINTADEMYRLGASLALTIADRPWLIFLHGDLGAGKTTLAQGLIQALVGKEHAVLSPTYSYMKSYAYKIPIHHFDLYRLDESQAHELGLDEFIDDEQALRLIEWPERLGPFQRAPDLAISILKNDAGREIIIKFFNELT